MWCESCGSQHDGCLWWKKPQIGLVYTGIRINLLFCLRQPDLDFDVFLSASSCQPPTSLSQSPQFAKSLACTQCENGVPFHSSSACALFSLSLVIVFVVVVAVGPCTKMISVTKHVAELCIRYQYMGFLSSLIHCEWPLVLCAFSDKSTLVSGLWMKASWMRIILSILLASHFAPTLLSPLSTLSLGICVLENENVFWIFKHFSFEFCRIQISIFITRPVEYVRNPRTHTKLMLVYIILFFFVSRVCLFVLHIWNMVLELAILSVDDSNERSRDGERPAVAVGKKIGKSDVR